MSSVPVSGSSLRRGKDVLVSTDFHQQPAVPPARSPVGSVDADGAVYRWTRAGWTIAVVTSWAPTTSLTDVSAAPDGVWEELSPNYWGRPALRRWDQPQGRYGAGERQ